MFIYLFICVLVQPCFFFVFFFDRATVAVTAASLKDRISARFPFLRRQTSAISTTAAYGYIAARPFIIIIIIILFPCATAAGKNLGYSAF